MLNKLVVKRRARRHTLQQLGHVYGELGAQLKAFGLLLCDEVQEVSVSGRLL
jgi:hypothetical protein